MSKKISFDFWEKKKKVILQYVSNSQQIFKLLFDAKKKRDIKEQVKIENLFLLTGHN